VSGGLLKFCAILLLTSLGPAFYWWWEGRLIELPDARGGGLHCVSYAPYRAGQSPFDAGFTVPRWQIEEDLKLLRAHVDCVRTYATDQGIDAVPEIAQALGMKVMLGAWIGGDPVNNARQITDLVRLANAYPDAIKAVIVGNEVLLRREQSAAALATMLREVKRQVPVPVTYADVWEFWLRNPSLADTVDFVTIHILPYWEDEPVGIEAAIRHVGEVLDRVRVAFSGRDLFVGETGWPSAGRQRQGAMPSPVNQARFMRAFVTLAKAQGIDHNLIEAFDQPWKRLKEGTVGGRWGLFSAERSLKYFLHGPMRDNPGWRIDLATGLLLAAILLAATSLTAPGLGWGRALGLAVQSQVAGVVLVAQAGRAIEASRGPGEWAVALAGLALSATIAALLLAASAGGGRGTPWPRPASVRASLDWLRHPRPAELSPALLLGLLQAAAGIAAAIVMLWFLVDARYRDLPIAAFLIPALGFAHYGWRCPHGPATGVEEAWLATLLLLGGPIIAFSEGPENYRAMAWMLVGWLMAAPWLGALRQQLTRIRP
jgi:exo-beta-1,3-glucanase (GH17 family)